MARKRNPWDLRAEQYEAGIAEGGAAATSRGQRASSAYLDQALDFDASSAYDEYMGAAEGRLNRNLTDRLANLRAGSVAGGRLDTGFFDEDQGEIIQDVAQDYANTASSAALSTIGMELDAMNTLGRYGASQEELGMEANAGLADRAMVRWNADEERAARKRRTIGSVLGAGVGGAAGFFLGGGPTGALAGAKLGATVGGTF